MTLFELYKDYAEHVSLQKLKETRRILESVVPSNEHERDVVESAKAWLDFEAENPEYILYYIDGELKVALEAYIHVDKRMPWLKDAVRRLGDSISLIDAEHLKKSRDSLLNFCEDATYRLGELHTRARRWVWEGRNGAAEFYSDVARLSQTFAAKKNELKKLEQPPKALPDDVSLHGVDLESIGACVESDLKAAVENFESECKKYYPAERPADVIGRIQNTPDLGQEDVRGFLKGTLSLVEEKTSIKIPYSARLRIKPVRDRLDYIACYTSEGVDKLPGYFFVNKNAGEMSKAELQDSLVHETFHHYEHMGTSKASDDMQIGPEIYPKCMIIAEGLSVFSEHLAAKENWFNNPDFNITSALRMVEITGRAYAVDKRVKENWDEQKLNSFFKSLYLSDGAAASDARRAIIGKGYLATYYVGYKLVSEAAKKYSDISQFLNDSFSLGYVSPNEYKAAIGI